MHLTIATDEDREFLFEVYAASREAEMALVPWTDEQKLAFLRWQFDLQDRHYRSQYAAAEFQVLHYEGHRIGRLYVHDDGQIVHVIDIAILPPWRGKGIGGGLMRDILERAAASKRAVSLYVEHHNPARRLYQRLGFQTAADEGVYLRLEWTGQPAEPA
jgi:ribosomal protein S18 acetylase RimI-like enzyme